MRKNFTNIIVLSIMILGCGIIVSGCGKKHEKIDLTGTTEAVEATMAPSAEATEPAETVPEPETETSAEVQTSAASGGSASAQDVVKPNPVTYTTASYTAGKVSIQYPVMENLDEAQSSVNDLIRLNALSAVNAYVKNPEADALDMKYQVLGANKSRITIVYTGTAMTAHAAYPVNVLYSNTIDVRNVSNLDLPIMADPRTLAEYVLSDKCVYSNDFGGADTSQADFAAAMAQLNAERNADWYQALFNAADFPASADGFPSCFSFEKDGDICFSIPVPHALGDYAVAVFTPENK